MSELNQKLIATIMMPSITNLPPMSNAAKGSLRELSTLVKYLSPYRWQIAGAILALLATSVSVLGMGAALRYLVDFGLSRGNAELLDRAYWQMMGVVVVLAAASYARFLLVAWLGERVVADVRRDVYARLVSLHIGFFETAKTGEILSRLTTDTSLLQTIIGGSIAVALRNIIMLTGGCIMLLHTSPKLTLYVFAIVPLVVVPIIIFGRRVRRHSRDSQDKVAALSAHGEETLSGIRTVQAFTLEHTERAQFERRLQDVLRTGLARIQAKAILTSIVISLVFGAIITVLWIGGRDVLAGRISGGELSAFVFYAAIVAGAVGALSEVMGDVQRAAGAAERIGELLALEPTIASPANPVPLPAGGLDIRFEHATFTYPARPNTPSISDMELSIQSGEMVALVGPSGAGKTTLFSLLLRFYDPQSGSIRLGGIDLRQLDLQQLRRAIGIVPQEPVIFSTDAMENIRCGRPEATDAEVIEAARAAAALDFLTALPQGLHTYLGEKGVQLSGGQKQRIAIARAIIRDPKILLLDEATSALDSENEHAVQEALARLMHGRTTLAIAHRLSTIQDANRIVLLEDGRIQAIGTHAELLANSPLYARLAKLQFKGE